MNVGDRVTAGGRGGLVTRAFPSGWLRVAIDGDKGLPQDYPPGAWRPARSGGTSSLDDWCRCGNRKSRHVVPCAEQEPQKPVTSELDDSAPVQPQATYAMPLLLDVPRQCRVCGRPLEERGSRGPARAYCSPRCRVAAHRAKATVSARDAGL